MGIAKLGLPLGGAKGGPVGGCDPVELAKAAAIGAEAGYCEINLNVGCPSDRVKSGAFGACLMLRPSLVAECVQRMREATSLPVTVKCRVGIDQRDDYAANEPAWGDGGWRC